MMKKFKKIYVEITNQCNLSCDFCPRSKRPAQTMTVSFFAEIIRKIKGYTDYLYFHVMGEPLMHPDIGEMLDICNKTGLKVNITTNGTLIKRIGQVIVAKPALRQINISLHCQSSHNNDGLRDDYFDDVIAFAKDVQKGKKKIVCLRLWNLSENGDTLDDNRILQRIGREFGCEDGLADQSKVFDGIKLADNIFINGAVGFEWPGFDKQDRGMAGFCLGLRDHLAILADGTVVPCCLDAQGWLALGNIGHQALGDILQGARAKAIYEGFSKRTVVEELCRKCGYRTRFDLIQKTR
jgi:radical SAM protein with 4Fe4S-binding SPASM domain